MKRFTDTEKWDRPWMLDAEPEIKLAWFFLCDRCDNAGVWNPSEKLLQFYVSPKLTIKGLLRGLQGALVELPCGKLWIPKFIEFQQGGTELNPNNKAHLGIIRLLDKHGLTYPEDIDKLRPLEGASKPLARSPSNSNSISNSLKGESEGENEQQYRFDDFYVLYPRKQGKASAQKKWKSLKCEKDFDAIMSGLREWITAWERDGTEKQFIPHPATWLNQRRWEDEQKGNGDTPKAQQTNKMTDEELEQWTKQRT